MQLHKLKNGITLIVDKRPTDSVAIEVLVKVGSNCENEKIAGISHFIEHMLFEGTKKRTAEQIANEIESIGGEINAATANERTYYYVSVLKKHFDKGLEILADIIQNPLFKEEIIKKERSIILDEISLVTDNPKFHQWVLFAKHLFKKHPTRNPLYGTREIVSKLNREDLINYYNKFYKSNNIIISIVGDVKEVDKKVEKAFSKLKKGKIEFKEIKEPGNIKTVHREKRQVMHSYLVLGYKVDKKDVYILDVIQAILFRGLSGRLGNEIRIKRGLSYNFGAVNEEGKDFAYFAAFVSSDKKNIEQCKKIILKELKLKNLKDKEIDDAKNCLEGSFILRYENNKEKADLIGEFYMLGKRIEDYVKNIKKVSKKDILNAVKKYFKNNYTEVRIEPLK